VLTRRRRAPHKKRGERRNVGRAFDKAVRRKPLAGAADAGRLWEFNRFLPEKLPDGIVPNVVLMFIDVQLLATSASSYLQRHQLFKGASSEACVYKRASVRRASGFVLNGLPEGTAYSSFADNTGSWLRNQNSYRNANCITRGW